MNVQKNVESIKNIPVDLDENSITQTDKNILSFLFPDEQTIINKNNLNSQGHAMGQYQEGTKPYDPYGRPTGESGLSDDNKGWSNSKNPALSGSSSDKQAHSWPTSENQFHSGSNFLNPALSGSTRKYNIFVKMFLLFLLFSILFLPSPLFILDKISENKKIHLAVKIVILLIFFLFLYKF